VIFSHDGSIDDPDTAEIEDWSFDIFRFSHMLVLNGAVFVNTAADVTNSGLSSTEYPEINLSTPGPGAFAAMIQATTFPVAKSRWVNVGKGGKEVNMYMMEKGVKLLEEQGNCGDKKKIVMIGDRLDTDVKGGNGININTVLVESGVHQKTDIEHYEITPTWIIPGLSAFYN